MLPTGATKGYLKGGEVTLKVFLYTLADDGFGMGKEVVDGWLFLQEFDDRTILASVGFVLGIAAGVGECTAVEDESAAVA